MNSESEKKDSLPEEDETSDFFRTRPDVTSNTWTDGSLVTTKMELREEW